MTEIEQNEALTKSLTDLANAANVAADALERLSKTDHGGVTLSAVGEVVKIEISAKRTDLFHNGDTSE